MCFAITSFSCTTQKCLYKSEIEAYNYSTRIIDYLNPVFVSVPINTGKYDENTGIADDNFVGYAILPIANLYNVLYKDKGSTTDFSNLVFRKLVDKREFFVTNEEYKKLEKYIIKIEDAKTYEKLNTEKLIKEYDEGFNMLPEVLKYDSSYKVRCVLHNLLHNGISVLIDDESGYPFYMDYRNRKFN